MRELAAQFLALAEKQETTAPLHDRASSHGHFLAASPEISRKHERISIKGDRALRSCRASSAGDAIWPRRQGGNLVLSILALWMLGYPEAALADADQALNDAREIGQAATLMYALSSHH